MKCQYGRRKLYLGQRFGPKLAMDGGRIFQSSTVDLEKIIVKKKYDDDKVWDLYKRGILQQWISRRKEDARIVNHDSKTGWTRWESRRVGALGVKIGMTQEVDMWGDPHPVTVVQLRENHILQVKSSDDEPIKDSYCSLQVGAGLKKLKKISKAMRGHFARAGVPPKQKIVEFKVTKDAMLPVGTRIYATHFVVGQFVNVAGVTKGRGTQGVMKKWGFSGLPATHGTSLTHRHAGAIGARQDPGKVWPGKKMAGRMGGKRRRTFNLQVMKINTEDEILFIRGSIPGPKGSWVEIRDSEAKPHRLPPPFPTHTPSKSKNNPKNKKYLRMRFFDPYYNERHTDMMAKWEEARKAMKAKGEEEDEEEGDTLEV